MKNLIATLVLIACLGSLTAQQRVLMPLIQLVNIDAQYEAGLSTVFVDEVNRLGKYSVIRPSQKDFYFSTIAEGCKYAREHNAYYFLTSFINISRNKAFLSFYLYDANTTAIVWQDEIRNIDPSAIEMTLIRLAAAMGERKVSDEMDNKFLRDLEKTFWLNRYITFGWRVEPGFYTVNGFDPAFVMTTGISMQYDIKSWFFEPGFTTGFGNVQPMHYFLSANKVFLKRQSSPYLGLGGGMSKTTAKLHKLSQDEIGNETNAGGFWYLEAGYIFSHRKVFSMRAFVKPSITSYQIKGGRVKSLSFGITFSVKP
jgi:hypothetical protein